LTSDERVQLILGHLAQVSRERQARGADSSLALRAQAIRRFQTERFRQTYVDLLTNPTTRPAAEFFLDELYGTQDFLARDAQFQRIVPSIVKLFSADVAETVALLAELHSLSETLDTRMARELHPGKAVDAETYGVAWRAVGELDLRSRQIDCVGLIGQRLIRYTTHPALGRALRLMRLPARAAKLHDLQAFLERGFDTFGALPDPQGFLATVQGRERRTAATLFTPPQKS
jgi:hypothetical protein